MAPKTPPASAARGKKAAAEVVPPEPEGPPMKQDIHFVLRIEAVLKDKEKPATPPLPDGSGDDDEAQRTAAPGAEDPGFDPPKPELDISTLLMDLKFLPWVGEEMAIKQGTLQKDEATESTPARQHYTVEHHFKLVVDESTVRAMVEARGQLALPLVIGQPEIIAPPVKVVKGAPPPPPPEPAISFTSMLPLDCSGLLVGDTEASQNWPSKRLGLPVGMCPLLKSIFVSLRALDIPIEVVAAAAIPKAGAKKPLTPKGGKSAPPAENPLDTMPGNPTVIMTPDLAMKLNPIVIRPRHAKMMPDSPASRAQLDIKCQPVRIAVQWSPKMAPMEQAGYPVDWAPLNSMAGGAVGGPKTYVRDLMFEEAVVIMGGDHSIDDLMAWSKLPLSIEVHDRTAIPDPPEFPIAPSLNEDGTPMESTADADDGYVCGIARIPMLQLSRGYSKIKFRTNVVPFTTIRGAASLDWTKRPGNYSQANAVLKGEVRCAVPLHKMVGVAPADKVFSRVVFVMDYRDSNLFHTLEDTVRRQNAWKLGLVEPKPIVIPDSPVPSLGASLTGDSTPDVQRSAYHDQSDIPQQLITVVSVSTTRGGLNKLQSMNASSVRKSVANSLSVENSLAASRTAEHQLVRTSTQLASRKSIVSQSEMSLSPSPSYTGGGGGVKALSISRRASEQGNGHKNSDAGNGKKELRFGGGHWGGSNSESEEEPEAPPTDAELGMTAALAELERIDLDMRLMQALSTTKLTPEQSADLELDLLTGFHLVDGKERIIVLEGIDESEAMSMIRSIIDWALDDDCSSENGWRRRHVVYNSKVRYPSRLWSSLGVDLYITKLRSPLTKLISEAGSYATGKVRVDCIQGLKKLGQLRNATWARLADDLCMFPNPEMIHLVDKKFGGELTKADVLGVEVEEFESDDEDGGAMGMGDGSDGTDRPTNDDARSHRSAKSGKSGKSRKSRRSSKTKPGKQVRKNPPPLPIDHINHMFLNMREQARQHRLNVDYVKNNKEMLLNLSMMALRDEWATWNPQRKAAQDLEKLVKQGTITLEETMAAHKTVKNIDPIPGSIPGEESVKRGWYPHQGPFKWPIPKAPGTYAEVAIKPSEFRVEQLAEPWTEGEMFAALQTRPHEPGFLPMITTVKNPTGQFNLDPEFVKTVHSGGAGREKELAEDKQKEKMDWHSKLVVDDPVMQVTLPLRSKPSQIDRFNHILQDEPMKKGFKISHAPALSTTLHQSERYVELPPVPNLRGTGGQLDMSTFTVPGADFQNNIAKDKRAVHKLPLNQSWQASLKDKRNNENP